MATNPAVLCDLGAELVDCVCSALVAGGALDADCCGEGRVFLAHGEVAWDDCCAPCGQLSVRLVRVYGADNPPDRATGPRGCGRRLVADWEALHLRCARVMANPEQGRPPSAPALTGETCELLGDLWLMTTGLECCFAEWRRAKNRGGRRGWVTNGDTVGPAGACAGARVAFSTVVGGLCDCGPIGA